jgi:hypothetical protein
MDLADRLNPVLPSGLEVMNVRPILFKTPSLMSLLEGASYHVGFPSTFMAGAGMGADALRTMLRAGIEQLLGCEHVLVRRTSEGQTREFDARSSIAALDLRDDDGKPVLEAHLRFTVRAQVRPDEIVRLLLPDADARETDVERVRLWVERDGRRLDPMDLLEAGAG